MLTKYNNMFPWLTQAGAHDLKNLFCSWDNVFKTRDTSHLLELGESTWCGARGANKKVNCSSVQSWLIKRRKDLKSTKKKAAEGWGHQPEKLREHPCDTLCNESGIDWSESTAFWGVKSGDTLHSTEMLHRKRDLTVRMEEMERKIGGRYRWKQEWAHKHL